MDYLKELVPVKILPVPSDKNQIIFNSDLVLQEVTLADMSLFEKFKRNVMVKCDSLK